MLDAAWAAGIRYFDAARSCKRRSAPVQLAAARAPSLRSVTVGFQVGLHHHVIVAGRNRRTRMEHSLAVLSAGSPKPNCGAYLKLYPLDDHVGERRAGRPGCARWTADCATANCSHRSVTRWVLAPFEIEIGGQPLFRHQCRRLETLSNSAGYVLAAPRRNASSSRALANGRLTPPQWDPSFADAATLAQRPQPRSGWRRRLGAQPSCCTSLGDLVLWRSHGEQVRSNAAARRAPWRSPPPPAAPLARRRPPTGPSAANAWGKSWFTICSDGFSRSRGESTTSRYYGENRGLLSFPL